MKILNSRGFIHEVLLVFVILFVGIAGVAFTIASHADARPKTNKLTMYDSADPSKIPKNAKVVAAYVGSQHSYVAAKKMFPRATIISINETPSSDEAADIWGIEPGGKTVSQTIAAIASGKAHGAYGVQSDLHAVRAGLEAQGVDRASYVLWLSGAGTQNFSSIPAGLDAHQYKYVAGQYDASTISSSFVDTVKGRSNGPIGTRKNTSKYYIYTAKGTYTAVKITSSKNFETARCNTQKLPNGKTKKIRTKPTKATDGTYLPVLITCITPRNPGDSYSIKFIQGSHVDRNAVVIETTTNSCLYVHSNDAASGAKGVTKTFARNSDGSCTADNDGDK